MDAHSFRVHVDGTVTYTRRFESEPAAKPKAKPKGPAPSGRTTAASKRKRAQDDESDSSEGFAGDSPPQKAAGRSGRGRKKPAGGYKEDSDSDDSMS